MLLRRFRERQKMGKPTRNRISGDVAQRRIMAPARLLELLHA